MKEQVCPRCRGKCVITERVRMIDADENKLEDAAVEFDCFECGGTGMLREPNSVITEMGTDDGGEDTYREFGT